MKSCFRNVALSLKVDFVNPIFAKEDIARLHAKIFFTFRQSRNRAMCNEGNDLYNTTARVVKVLIGREVRGCYNC